MSTTYTSAVPLAMVRTVDGGYVSVYQDEPIAGESIEPENLKRLVRKGFLVEKAADDETAAGDGPPAKSASKGDWEAYARSQGATDDDLDGMTKDELVSTYGS